MIKLISDYLEDHSATAVVAAIFAISFSIASVAHFVLDK